MSVLENLCQLKQLSGTDDKANAQSRWDIAVLRNAHGVLIIMLTIRKNIDVKSFLFIWKNASAKTFLLSGVAFGILALGLSSPALAQSAYCVNSSRNATVGTVLGTNAVACGDGADAVSSDSVAVGYDASATFGAGAIAIGDGASAYGPQATAIGNGAEASTGSSTNNGQSTAIGAYVGATGDQSTALGNNAQAQGNSSVAIGGDDLNLVAGTTYTAIVNGKSVTATGAQLFTDLTGSAAIASGVYYSPTAGDASVALGPQARAGGTSSSADPGGTWTATGEFDVAIGAQSDATGFSSIALGTGAQATADTSFAIGPNAQATAPGAMAYGLSTVANRTDALAVGAGGTSAATYTQATGAGATALGGNATAGANAAASNAVAIGGQSSVVSAATSGVAIGNSATADGAYGVALGSGAVAKNAGDMALGENSITSAPSTGPYTINGGTAAGTSDTSGVVSVGTSSAPRQIQNVAAGSVTSSSLDAVNGSQLYAVGNSLNNLGSAVASSLGGASSYTATSGLTTSLSVGGTNYTNVQNALTAVNTTASKGWNLSANGGTAVNVAPGATVNVAQGSSGNIKVTQSGTGLTIDTNPDLTATQLTTGDTVVNTSGVTITGGTSGTVSLTNTGLNNGGNVLTGVGAGALTSTSTDAVNGSQLYATNQTVSSIANGKAGPFVSDNSVITTQPVSSGKNAAAGGFGASATGAASTVIGNQATDNGNADATVLGEEASIASGLSGSNVALGQGSTVTAAATPTANGVINGSTYSFAGGTPSGVVSIGTASAPRQLTNVAAGQIASSSTDAVNGSELYATNTALGTLGTSVNNLGGSVASGLGGSSAYNSTTGTVTTALSVGGDTYNSVNSALNAIDTTASKGWNLSANGGTAVNVAPGATVNVAQGSSGNIKVTQSGTGLTIDTNPDLTATLLTTGDTVVNTRGVSVSGGVSGTVSLTDAGLNNGGNVISGVAPGAVSATSTQAINGSQLNATNNVVNNLGSSVASGLGGGSTYNSSTGTVSTSLLVGGNTYTTVDGALDGLASSGLNFTDAGTKDVVHADLGGTLPIIGATQQQVAALSTDPATAGAYSSANVQTYADASTSQLQVQLATNPVFTSVTTGDTVLSSSGVSIAGGSNGTVSLTDTGLDNGGNVITGVTAGTAGTDAVNVNQLDAVNATAGEGWNLSANGGTAVNVAPGATVNVAQGSSDNITVSQNGTGLTIDTSATPSFTSVTTGDTVLSSGGVTITGGSNGTVSLTDAGLYNGGNVISGVTPGTAGTDAVNVNQLDAVNATASAGWNLSANGGTAVNVAPGATVNVAQGSSGNIKVTQSGTDLTIDTSATPSFTSVTTGDTVLSGSGVTIGGGSNGTVSLTDAGLDNGGNVITGVGVGTLSSTSTEAVNGSQLYTLGTNVASGLGGDSTYTATAGLTTSLSAGGNTYDSVQGALNGLASSGLNFTDAGTADVVHADLGGTLPIIGATQQQVTALSSDAATAGAYSSANLQTYADASTGKLQVQLATNPVFTSVTAGDTVLNSSGVTITGGTNGTASLTDAGLDNGNNVITGVAAGTAGTDAVNVSQLDAVNEIAKAGWNLSANGGTAVTVAPGATVNVAQGSSGNITVSQNGTGLTIDTNPDLTATQLTTGDTVVNGNGVSIIDGLNGAVSLTDAGLDNGGNVITGVAAGMLSSTSTEAVNGSQLYALGNSVASGLGGDSTFDAGNGTVTTSLLVGGNTYNSVNSALDALNATASEGWNLTTNGNDSSSATVAPGGTVDVSAGSSGNITVSQSGADLTIDTNPNLTATSVTTGDTTMNSDGVTVSGTDGASTVVNSGGVSVIGANGGSSTNVTSSGITIASANGGTVSLTDTGLDNGGNVINGVAGGEVSATSQQAVNGSQLYAVSQEASAGWNLSSNGGTSANVAPGATVNVSAGSSGNITVSQSRTNLTIDTNPNLTASSVTISNGGPSLSSSGLDANNTKITNLAPGTDPGDAVNLAELPIQYSTPAGTPTPADPTTNDVTLVGPVVIQNTSSGTYVSAPVTVHNVAAGTAPTDAANVGQLPGSWQSTTSNTFVFDNANATTSGPTMLTNVASGGISAFSTDAVNGSQLYATDQAVNNLSAFTVQGMNNLQHQINTNRALESSGVASAMALGSIRYDDRPGKLSLGFSTGAFDSQVGLAFGAGFTSKNDRWRFSAGVTMPPTDMRGTVGGAFSFTYTLN